MKDKELYKKAIETWGRDLQVVVAIEELSELQKELTKALRSGYSADGIAEEIADVKIMLEQLEIIFNAEDYVGFWKDLKLSRLEKKLKEAVSFSEAIKSTEDKEAQDEKIK